MKRILSAVLLLIMLLPLCACGDKTEYPKAVDVDTVEDFFDGEIRYLPDEENMLTVSEETEGGFLVKEKRFTYEYKDYILFDITNETDKNYNLTVHAKYFDAEGKRLDETWEVYSDFASGHQQYILLDPMKKIAECEYDFQVKETESDCWRSKVTVEPSSMHISQSNSNAPAYLNIGINLDNQSDRTVYVKFKCILVFDSAGEIYLITNYGVVKMDPRDDVPISCILDEKSKKEDLVIPEELQNGFTVLAVIESITYE